MGEPEIQTLWKKHVPLVTDEYVYWMEGVYHSIKNMVVPNYLLRFEDMLQNTEETCTDLVKFLLSKQSIDGTMIQ